MSLASLNTKDVGDVLSSIREQMSNPELASTGETVDNGSDVLILTKALEDDGTSFEGPLEDNKNKEAEPMAETLTTLKDETTSNTTLEATPTESPPEDAFKDAQSEVEEIFSPTQTDTQGDIKGDIKGNLEGTSEADITTVETFQTDPSSFEAAGTSTADASTAGENASEHQTNEGLGSVADNAYDAGNSTDASGSKSYGSGITENLMSPSTVTESAKAFSELSGMINQIHQQTTKAIEASEPFSVTTAGNYTLDNLMKELLKPMLKEWLDAHLPSLVKWLVAEQIEKMLLANGISTAGTIAGSNTPEESKSA